MTTQKNKNSIAYHHKNDNVCIEHKEVNVMKRVAEIKETAELLLGVSRDVKEVMLIILRWKNERNNGQRERTGLKR